MKKKILIISGIVIAVICIAVIVALICQPGDSEGYEGVLENNELEENKQNAPILTPDGSTITNNTEKEETNPIPDISAVLILFQVLLLPSRCIYPLPFLPIQ